MKSNKFSLIALLTLSGVLACAPISQAQTNTTPTTPPATPGARARGGRGGGAAGQALQAALDKLDLTPDQKTKVAAAVADQRTKTAGLRGTTPPLTAAERRAKTKEISDAFDAALKGILTADQYAKWLTVKPPPAAGGRRGARGAGAGAAGGAGGAGTTTPPAGGSPAPTP